MSQNQKYMNQREKRVLTEFINIYRNEPCLWMTKCQEYRDRQLKDEAYERLAVKLREIDPDADRDRVVKKINCLRTNYRKENRKIGERTDKVNYKPRLWYYHLFDFLEGHEFLGPNPFDTNDSRDTFEDFDEYENDPLKEMYNEIDEYEVQQQKGEEEDHQEIKPTMDNMRNSFDLRCANTKRPVTPPQIKKLPAPKLKRPRAIIESSDDSDNTGIHLKEIVPRAIPKIEDRYEIFARIVAMKLRSLSDKRQRLLAEKAINDALFMAEIGELTLDRVNASLNFDQTQSGTDFIRPSTSNMHSSGTNGGNIF